MTRSEDAERAYRLRGLDPQHYGQRRRPDPEAAREMARLDAAPIAFELALKTLELQPVRNEKERAALEEAIVLSIGRSSHPAAELALTAIARDDRFFASSRRLAVSELKSERALVAFLSDEALRAGAVQGLGQVRTLGSVRALIGAAKDPALRLAAIRSLASAASPFVLHRQKNADAEAIRREASRALISMLAEDEAHAGALVESIAIVAAPSAIEQLTALEAGAGERARERIARAKERLARRR